MPSAKRAPSISDARSPPNARPTGGPARQPAGGRNKGRTDAETLAERLNVSEPLVYKLERRLVRAATIPPNWSNDSRPRSARRPAGADLSGAAADARLWIELPLRYRAADDATGL